MKKTVVIEGQKSRPLSKNGKYFNRLDQKCQLQIKKIIQNAISEERLDLSEKNILRQAILYSLKLTENPKLNKL